MAPVDQSSMAHLLLEAEAAAGTLDALLVDADRVARTVAQGVHGRRRTGLGDSFWQYRRYRDGDASTSIDWRHSARSQHVYVRETEWEAAETVWLWADPSASLRYASDTAVPEKRDRALLLAAALAYLLTQGGERVAVLGSAEWPSASRSAVGRLIAALAEAEGDSTPPGLADLPRDAHVVLISDFLSPLGELERQLDRMLDRDLTGTLIQVADPAEEDFPFSGRTRFRDMSDRQDLTVGRAETLTEAYRARYAGHIEGLRDLATGHAQPLIRHRTDHAPAPALLAAHEAIRDRDLGLALGSAERLG